MEIMKEWPEWAWVGRHAENSRCDQLVMIGPGNKHVFPHAEPMWYCNRNWGPQEYIEYRLKLLRAMAEDVQKLVKLFEEPKTQTGHELIALSQLLLEQEPKHDE